MSQKSPAGRDGGTGSGAVNSFEGKKAVDFPLKMGDHREKVNAGKL